MRKYIILLGLIIQSCVGLSDRNTPLYKIEVDSRFGFINKFGDEIISPTYMYATDFNEGVALVVIDTLFSNDIDKFCYKYNYIDNRNKKIFKEDFTLIPELYLSLLKDDKDKVIEYLNKFNFNCGLALNQNEDNKLLYGYIDLNGDIIIPHEYGQGLPFSENKTYVQQSFGAKLGELESNQAIPIFSYECKWKIINTSNESLTDYIFISTVNQPIIPYKNNRSIGFIAISTADEIKYTANLLDENAKIIKVIPNLGEEFSIKLENIGFPKLENAWEYGLYFTRSNDIIAQNAGSLSGFGCNSRFFSASDGTEIPTFEQLSEKQQLELKSMPRFQSYLGSELPITYTREASEDLIPCQYINFDKLSSSWFYVNKHHCVMGTESNVAFHDALPFSNGLAPVKKDGKWGYINSEFEIVIPCQYDYAESFNNNLAKVKIENGNTLIVSYIDKNGNIIWQNIEYSDPQMKEKKEEK